MGAGLVLPVSSAAPDGVLGIVTSRRPQADGSTLVTTRAAALDELYKRFHAHIEGTLADARRANSAGAVSAAIPPSYKPEFKCERGIGPKLALDVDLTKLKYIFDINVVSTQPSILFQVNGRLPINGDIAFSGADGCRATARFQIPVGTSGIMVEVVTSFSVEATGSVGVRWNWEPHIAYGFFRSRSSGDYDVKVFNAKAAHDVGFAGEGKLEVFPAVGVGISAGGVAGVTGSFGPAIEAGVSVQAAPAKACLGVEAMLKAALTAYADVLIKDWTFDLGSITFGRRWIGGGCVDGSEGGTLPNGGGDTPPARIRARSAYPTRARDPKVPQSSWRISPLGRTARSTASCNRPAASCSSPALSTTDSAMGCG